MTLPRLKADGFLGAFYEYWLLSIGVTVVTIRPVRID
jgi:hypothetical protein